MVGVFAGCGVLAAGGVVGGDVLDGGGVVVVCGGGDLDAGAVVFDEVGL